MSAPNRVDYGLLFLLGLIWGGSFLFIKLSVSSIPPISLTLGRLIIGAVAFALVLKFTGRKLPTGNKMLFILICASLLGMVIPFILISWGEERISSGLAAILMAGMPLMTVVLARFFGNEPLTPAKLVGVAFGFIGLVILIGPDTLSGLGGDGFRQLALVLASACYAVNALIMKRLSGHDPYCVSAALMLTGSVLLLPFCLLIDQPWTLTPTATAVSAMVVLGLLPTAAASIIMLAILRRQGASFFAQINFLVPLFGVAWGFAVLSERPPASAFLALVVILTGVAISRNFSRNSSNKYSGNKISDTPRRPAPHIDGE